MAMAMDRSKYRNPDMPIGYVKKSPELRYKYGVEIDGIHYIYAPFMYEAHIEEREDYATLSDLILSSDEDEGVPTKKDNVNDVATVASSSGDVVKIKKEKETVTIKQEAESFGGARKKTSKYGKKAHDATDTSSLDHTLSQMDIDPDKREKRKKHKKSKREHKREYRSDSSSPRSVYSCASPPSQKHRTSTKHRSWDRSPSPGPSRTSSSYKNHSPSRQMYKSSSKKIVSYEPSPSPSPSPPPRQYSYDVKFPPEQYYDVKPLPEEHYDVKIKEEPIEEPQHLFGSYHCEVCNITMNSLLTFNTHRNGKKHRKNMKLKNVSEVVKQSMPATAIQEDQSRYPKPPPGVIRKKVNRPAKIQHVIENMMKLPCPGLQFVTEIQGIGETQYYCHFCDCTCSSSSITSHLAGFKHRLRSVKHFKPGDFETMQNEPKYNVEAEVLSILRAVQKKEGMGRITVEVEELTSDYGKTSHKTSQPSTSRGHVSQPSTSRDYVSQPSTSRGPISLPSTSRGGQPIDLSFQEKFRQTAIPTKNASDFYCEICQSHMNSLGMWDAHIRGKRHLTNLKKMPGDKPSKTKTVAVRQKAHILSRLEAECPYEPIVGLDEVRETAVSETQSHLYQCFLCGSCHTSLDIIEHLISLKHRAKYLDHIEFPGREVTYGMSDSTAYNLIRDMCGDVEKEEGRGNPEVHVTKSSLSHR